MCIYVCICICFTLAYFLRKKCYLSLKVTTHYWPSNLGLQKSGNNKIKIDCAYQFNIWRQSNMIFCLRHTQSFSFHVFWTYIRLHPLSFFKLRIFDTCIIFFNGWIIYNALRMTDQTWYFPVPQTVWMTCLDHHSQRHISHKHILKLFYENGVSMKIDILEVSTVPPSYLPWNVHFEICWNSLDMSKRQIAGLLIISKKKG